jgi:hypothetical protein
LVDQIRSWIADSNRVGGIGGQSFDNLFSVGDCNAIEPINHAISIDVVAIEIPLCGWRASSSIRAESRARNTILKIPFEKRLDIQTHQFSGCHWHWFCISKVHQHF